MQRGIQKHLPDPLANLLQSGDLPDSETKTVSSDPAGLIIGLRSMVPARANPERAVVQ